MRAHQLIWQTAVVRQSDSGELWMEFCSPADCRRCKAGSGCGAGLFARLFVRKPALFRLPGDHVAQCGSHVRVGIAASDLVTGAAWLYGVPLVLALTGAVLADVVWPGSDVAALFGGLIVGTSGLFIAHRCAPDPRSPVIQLISATGLESDIPGKKIPP